MEKFTAKDTNFSVTDRTLDEYLTAIKHLSLNARPVNTKSFKVVDNAAQLSSLYFLNFFSANKDQYMQQMSDPIFVLFSLGLPVSNTCIMAFTTKNKSI